jgi:phage tail tape-measure protein
MARRPKLDKVTDPDAPKSANPDPITGERGAHPLGAGLGAAAGGLAAGAAVGAVTGPLGAAAGAVVGGVIGGLAGKGVAEQIDPSIEAAYWRDEYPLRDYYDEDVTFDELAPAYQYGWESRARYDDRDWVDVEPELERDWNASPTSRELAWDRARLASRDAWDRIDEMAIDDVEDDGL